MRSDARLGPTANRSALWGVVALAAVVAATVLAGTSASQTNQACTATGSSLIGGPDRDVLCGTSGGDDLHGAGGGDELRGFGGRDDLFGGPGTDQVIGGSGGDDIIPGTDFDASSKGGSGDDFLNLRDGVLDSYLTEPCGTGDDILRLDLRDALDAPAALVSAAFQCETIDIGAVDEGPNVRISGRALRVSEDGQAAVRLRCPGSLEQPPRCAGNLRLQLATRRSLRGRAPRARYSLDPGEADNVPVRLSRRDRRSLERRGQARGVATSVEKGHSGDKTTLVKIKLRARG